MSGLDTDAIAARLNAYEKFKNGGYVDRGNGVSQLEVAQRIQATNNLHTHASGDIAALLAEVATLRGLLVRAERLVADDWEGCSPETEGIAWLRDARCVLESGTEEPQQ